MSGPTVRTHKKNWPVCLSIYIIIVLKLLLDWVICPPVYLADSNHDEFHNNLEDTNPALSPSTHPDSDSTDVIEPTKDSTSVDKDTLLKEEDCRDTDKYLNIADNCDQVPLTESLSEKTDDCTTFQGAGSHQLNSDPRHFSLSAQHRSRLKLLLCRGSLFVVGIAVLIAGGILSRYHPDITYGNYSECVNMSQNSSAINVSDLALWASLLNFAKTSPTQL